MSQCIEYEGKRNRNGYGVSYKQGKPVGAHRVAWEQANGPIPDGMHVLHRCDNPACIRIDHLFLGSHADNMADRNAKGRQARQPGESNGRARLTNKQVAEIHTAYTNQFEKVPRGTRNSWVWRSNAPELAAQYGVSVGTIKSIVTGKRWSADACA